MLKGSDINVETAARLGSAFELKNVHYVAVHVQSIAREERVGATLVWQHTGVRMSWLLQDGELRATIPLTIAIAGQAEGEMQALAVVEVTLRLDYAIRAPAAGVAEDDIDHFVGVSSLLHAWPYLRAEVQALTAKIELNPLVLPLLVSGSAALVVMSVARGEPPAPVVVESGAGAPKRGKKKASKKVARAKSAPSK